METRTAAGLIFFQSKLRKIPRTGDFSYSLNLFPAHRDQVSAGLSAVCAGPFVKIIKPNGNEPIQLHSTKPGIATILIRFLIFLGLAVIVLTLAWLK